MKSRAWPQTLSAWPADWRHRLGYRFTHASLTSHHGEKAAAQIVRGEHKPTNEDLYRWHMLGCAKP